MYMKRRVQNRPYNGGFQEGVWIWGFSENLVHVKEGILSSLGALGEVVNLGLVG